VKATGEKKSTAENEREKQRGNLFSSKRLNASQLALVFSETTAAFSVKMNDILKIQRNVQRLHNS
jgi:hypothetical protein